MQPEHQELTIYDQLITSTIRPVLLISTASSRKNTNNSANQAPKRVSVTLQQRPSVEQKYKYARSKLKERQIYRLILDFRYLAAYIQSLSFNLFLETVSHRVAGGHGIDFNQRSPRQGRYSIAHPGGVLALLEVGSIDRIDLLEVGKVSEQDGRFGHATERRVCSLKGTIQVLHDLVSLPFDVILFDLSSFWVDGNLPGDEEKVAYAGDGSIGSDSLGDALGKDSLNFLHKI